MTLKRLEDMFKDMREHGANDDTKVYTFDYYDFANIQDVEYDPLDNSINILPE